MSIILVTGGNRGIGAGIIQALAPVSGRATFLVASRSQQSTTNNSSLLEGLQTEAKVESLQLDITQDDSIRAAVADVERRFGKLDVLINNAGEALQPASDSLQDVRSCWARNLDSLFTSQVLLTKAFVPLLRKSESPRVIAISSARGSLTRNQVMQLPPSVNWSYDCAKAALNLAMIEFRNEEIRSIHHTKDHITFWAVGPGHCKTQFNGFRGLKDPRDGAEVVVRLLQSRKGEIPSGTLWEYEYGTFQQIPW